MYKNYILHRHYNNKHLHDYSKYVGQKKYNLIEGLKLVHQGCNSISHVDNTTSSKALIASYAISNLVENIRNCLRKVNS